MRSTSSPRPPIQAPLRSLRSYPNTLSSRSSPLLSTPPTPNSSHTTAKIPTITIKTPVVIDISRITAAPLASPEADGFGTAVTAVELPVVVPEPEPDPDPVVDPLPVLAPPLGTPAVTTVFAFSLYVSNVLPAGLIVEISSEHSYRDRFLGE